MNITTFFLIFSYFYFEIFRTFSFWRKLKRTVIFKLIVIFIFMSLCDRFPYLHPKIANGVKKK